MAFVNEVTMVLKYIDLAYHIIETYLPFFFRIDLESVLPITEALLRARLSINRRTSKDGCLVP